MPYALAVPMCRARVAWLAQERGFQAEGRKEVTCVKIEIKKVEKILVTRYKK